MAVAPRRFNDYSMEVPLESDQCPLTAANYKVAATVGIVPDFMVAVPLLVDSGAVMNLVNLNFLPKKWHSAIQPYQGNPLNSANQSTLEVVGVIKLCLCLGDLKVKVRFGVARHLVTRLLVGTPFIDNFVKGIFPPERQIVPQHSKAVPILASNSPDMVMATEDGKNRRPHSTPHPR